MTPSCHRFGFVLALFWVLVGCTEPQASPAPETEVTKGGDERTGQYDVVRDWWGPAPDHGSEWGWGDVAGVAVDHPDRIIVIARGDRAVDEPSRVRPANFVTVVNRNGEIVERWTQWDSIFTTPHQVFISPYDPDRHVWIVDNQAHQVLKFTNDGSELVMRLGNSDHSRTQEEARANPSPGPYTYGYPSVLAFLPDGSFYLADGYWHSRVIKYSAEGEYILEWGSLGSGPGQFDLLHGLAIDRDGRVYVADRRNSRIQLFTADGEFIEEWPDIFDPVNIQIDVEENVWVLDASLNRVLKYNRDGELLYHWGTYGRAGAIGRGTWPGGLALPHQMDLDEEGNLYVASYSGGWVDKFVPKAGAPADRLFRRQLRLDD